MATPKHYCVREAAEFPAEQFTLDENGIRVHRRGQPKNWHYATTGEPLTGSTHIVTETMEMDDESPTGGAK